VTDHNIMIQPEHRPQLARLQHVLEWLQGERARIEAELAHVAAQGQRTEAQLRTVLLRAYGIAPQQPFTLDADAGTITVPHAEPEQPEPAAEPVAPAPEATTITSGTTQ
jgi:hypothetical protein